jgi:uncharacterized phage protein gp47/JayE
MPWPLPNPTELAERLARGFEREFAPLAGPEGVDASSPQSVLGAVARVQAMGAFDLYLFLQRLAQELLPDTATEELARHAGVWGVPRLPASAAAGQVTFAGVNGLVLPSGIELLAGAQRAVTTAGGTIAGGTLTVSAVASTPGAAGNFAAGSALALVAPIAGLSAQAAVVAAPGFAGGRDEEDEGAWRARLLARIRGGVPYGQAGAYAAWALQVPGVAVVAELPGWVGLGSVGVAFAMGSAMAPAVPTAPEVAAVQAMLDANRPVTAVAVALPVALRAIDLTIRVEPDTAAVRSALTAALAVHLAREPGVGGVLRRSRLSEALSSAAGEFAHRIDLPAGDVVLAPTELAVPGTITWAAS